MNVDEKITVSQWLSLASPTEELSKQCLDVATPISVQNENLLSITEKRIFLNFIPNLMCDIFPSTFSVQRSIPNY